MMDTPAGFTGPINTGNPGEFRMPYLAENALRVTGSTSKSTFEPLPQDDPRQRQPDIALAKEKLAWQPAVALTGCSKRSLIFASHLRCECAGSVHVPARPWFG